MYFYHPDKFGGAKKPFFCFDNFQTMLGSHIPLKLSEGNFE